MHAALIKVCLAFEHGVLPANLHYTKPNPNNESLKAGVLKVRRNECVLRLQYACFDCLQVYLTVFSASLAQVAGCASSALVPHSCAAGRSRA